MSSSTRLPVDVGHLRIRVAGGEHFHFLFFWGHQVPKDGSINKSCLSQWYPAPFTINGALYPTAEHWMMAEKARLFGDREMEEQILAASTPKVAKALGRRVRRFDGDVWSANCRDVVTRGNMAKFSQNPPLAAFLLGTSGQVLVEASPTDRIWGIGMREMDERARDPATWQGPNLLGFALMDVREQLSASRNAPETTA